MPRGTQDVVHISMIPQAPERTAAAVGCIVQQLAESINLTEMKTNYATITDEDFSVSVDVSHIAYTLCELCNDCSAVVSLRC